MNDPINPTPPSDQFLLNALCSRCGYDLRANNITGPCPNCGHELAYASFQSGLASANPIWLQSIYLAIGGIALAQAIFAVYFAINLLAIFAQSDPFRRSFYAWSRLYESAAAIQWFCAIFLLAAPEHRTQSEPLTSSRKLLVYFASAYAILYVINPALWRFLPFSSRRSPLPVPRLNAFHLAAVTCLFLYIQRIGQRDGNPIVKRHLPIAVTLIIINSAIPFIIPLARNLNSIEEITSFLMTGTAAYLVYVLLQLRRSIGGLLYPAKVEQPSDQPPSGPN